MKKILVIGIVFIIGSFNAFSIMNPKPSNVVSYNLYFNQGFLNVDNIFNYNNYKFKIDEYVTTHNVGFGYKNFFKTYEELNDDLIPIGYFIGYTYNSYNFGSQDLMTSKGSKKLDFKIKCYNLIIGADFHIAMTGFYLNSAIKVSYFDSNELIITEDNSDPLKHQLYNGKELENYYFSEFQSSIIIGIGRQIYLKGSGINIELSYEQGLKLNENFYLKRINLGIIYEMHF